MGEVVSFGRRRLNGPWHWTRPEKPKVVRATISGASAIEIRRLHDMGRTVTEIGALLRVPYSEVMRAIDQVQPLG